MLSLEDNKLLCLNSVLISIKNIKNDARLKHTHCRLTKSFKNKIMPVGCLAELIIVHSYTKLRHLHSNIPSFPSCFSDAPFLSADRAGYSGDAQRQLDQHAVR